MPERPTEPTSPHDPAARFVLACLRGRWLPEAEGDARAIAAEAGFDWDAVLRLAAGQRVAPLLYAVAREWALLPPRLDAELRRLYRVSAVRNMAILADLRRALDRLAAADVGVVALKGAALAEDVYADAALRPMGDTDLLVPARDVAAAVAALAPDGFAAVGAEPRRGAHLAFENEIVLGRAEGHGVPVELHWSLFDSPHYQSLLPMDWFWQTAVPGRVAGGTSLVLSPEAQVLHLCGHLALHHHAGSAHLLWRHDVAEVIFARSDGLDWDLVLTKAAAFDLVISLQAVLPDVAGAWAAPVPPDVVRRLAALQPSPGERRLHERLSPDRRAPAQRLWADLAATPGWRARLRLTWANLVPSPAYMRRRYRCPSPLVPLAYPYRWFVGLAGLLARRRPRS